MCCKEPITSRDPWNNKTPTKEPVLLFCKYRRSKKNGGLIFLRNDKRQWNCFLDSSDSHSSKSWRNHQPRMNSHQFTSDTRRDFLTTSASGIGGVAMHHMLSEELAANSPKQKKWPTCWPKNQAGSAGGTGWPPLGEPLGRATRSISFRESKNPFRQAWLGNIK